MKLNQELVNRLAAGEIVYQHTGNLNTFKHLMTAVLGKDVCDPEDFKDPFFISPNYPDIWLYYIGTEAINHPNLPIFTTEQFFESEPDTTGELQTERVFWQCNPNENPYGDDETDHVPDTKQTMDAETRELAKQLFIHNDNLTQAECIEFAIDFIKILNKHE
jgi:hypothetical protein